MNTYTFTLVLNRLVSENETELLYEHGLNALIGQTNNVPTMEIDADALTLTKAIVSTIEIIVQIIPTLKILEVQTLDLVSLPEIAVLTGRSRQNIHQLATQKRGPGGWPPPINPGSPSNRLLWRFTDVADWWQTCMDSGQFINAHDAHALAAINAYLRGTQELRYLLPEERQEILELAAA